MKYWLFLMGSLFLVASYASPAPQDFEKHFQEALPLCLEYTFPNSMARQPGFDIDAHLDEVAKEIREESKFFQSDKGRQFLNERFKNDPDEMNKQCAQYLLNPPD